MKTLFTCLSLIIAATSYAQTIEGSKSINAVLDYATVEATVACITKYHPQSEGEEYPEIFFVNPNEYAQKKALTDKGYTQLNSLANGMICSRSSNMPHAGVGLYDNASEVRRVIKEENIAVKTKVIFVNNKKLKESVNAQTSKVINSLIEK